MWWGPKFAFYGAKAAAGNVPESKDINPANVAFKFGIVIDLFLETSLVGAWVTS